MTRTAILTALVLMSLSHVATAQRPQVREGFWISGGPGYGSLDLACDGCETDREGGLTLVLAMGGTVGRGLLLGGEIEGWGKEIEGVDLTVGHVSGVVYWYPRPTAGFFVKGGAGIASYSVDAGPLGEEDDAGLGLHAALGYDFRVGRNLSLTPSAGVFWGDFEGGDADVLHVGVAVTGH
ncbi:MAG TPA: hypothetical protein VFZ26_13680 [Gemmatimonadales bacterium]